MARTFVDQPTQVFHSDDYDDTLPVGNGLQTGSLTLEDDLNALRTQIRQILWAGVSGSWYDGVTAPSGSNSARGLNTINFDLTDLEQKRFLFRRQNLANLDIATGSNVALLSTSYGTAPLNFAVVGHPLLVPTRATGSIVALLSASLTGSEGIWGTASTALVSGTTITTPLNLVLVRDAWLHTVLTTSNGNQEIFGLLQVESSASTGDAFNDVNRRTQISFIYEAVHNGTSSLRLVPANEIGGRTIHYSYIRRTALDDIPEDAYLSSDIFIDIPIPVSGQFATFSDITLQNAINNQGNTTVVSNYNTTIDINNTGNWSYVSGATTLWSINSSSLVTNVTNVNFNIGDQNNSGSFTINSGSTNLFSVYDVNGTSSVYFNVNNFFISSSTPTDFTNGIIVGSGSSRIFIDVYPGNGTGPTNTAVIATASGSNLIVSGGNQLIFKDFYSSGSSGTQWPSGGIPFSTSTIEWNNFYSQFGATSILGAFVSLSSSLSNSISSKRYRVSAGTTPNTITAHTNVTFPTNLDAPLLNYVGKSFINDMNIYLNGILLFNGYTAGNANDVYPGTSPASGDLKFPMKLRSGSIISMEIF